MVFSMTVEITDHTAAAQDLATLFKQGSQTGYTVVPSVDRTGQLIPTTFGYRSVQASAGNSSGTTIYVGDENTANDGSCQGIELAPGNGWDRDIMTNRAGALGVYVRGSADGVKFNVMLESV